MSETRLRSAYAALIVELCDIAENDVSSQGMIAFVGGYKRGISPAFRYWWKELRRARIIHRQTAQTVQFKEWWDKNLGTLGKLPLTRRRLANSVTCPRNWSLKLL